jgi:hypothetical protein
MYDVNNSFNTTLTILSSSASIKRIYQHFDKSYGSN